jgi:hypothetical protein
MCCVELVVHLGNDFPAACEVEFAGEGLPVQRVRIDAASQ